GNFIFRLNIREVEKMMTALNHGCIAYRHFNDFYHPRISVGEYGAFRPRTLLTEVGIAVQDLLCSLRLMNPGLACLVAFKEAPSTSLRDRLIGAGFRVVDLPENPYQ